MRFEDASLVASGPERLLQKSQPRGVVSSQAARLGSLRQEKSPAMQPFDEDSPISAVRGRVLVLLKGPSRGRVMPDLPADRAEQLLTDRLKTLRAVWPDCDARFVLVSPDDPAGPLALRTGHGVLVREADTFAEELRQAARGAWGVAVIPASNLLLVPEILDQGARHLGFGADAVYFDDASLGVAPEILLRPGLMDFLSDDDLRDTFFARLRRTQAVISVTEHGYAHADIFRQVFGSLRVESPWDLARLDRACGGAFSLKGLGLALEAEHARCVALLEEALRTSAAAPADLPELNARLALLEYHRGSRSLASFPVEVCLNLTDMCNAHCVFCGYFGTRPAGETVRLEDLARLDWLRFARLLMLHGGYGEPLMHPRFAEVVGLLRERFPALDIGVPTNGACLQGDKLVAALEHLNLLRVSLNAATPETHARLMPPLSFESILDNVEALARLRAERGSGPRIGFNYVLYQANASELPQLPDLAARLGVDVISVEHCKFGASPLVDESMALPADPMACNAILAETAERCREHGLECHLPPPCSHTRVLSRPDHCREPWTHLFVSHDRETFVCCGANLRDLGLPAFEWLSTESFRERVWNAPGLVRLRTSLLDGPWAPQCRRCKWGG